VLVGRSHALQSLRDAYEASSHGAVCLLVHGPSGIGKSALLRHFLDELAGARDVLVASSRCFERESVPYKALDGVVDRMSEHLPDLIGPALCDLPVPNIAALLQTSSCSRAART
jgi:predicted ATPase